MSQPSEWRLYRRLRLAALVDAPDAYGSTLQREEGWNDDVWRSRLASPDSLPLVADVDGQAVGLASGVIYPAHPEGAHVFQMWVAPTHRGGGMGQMLLAAIIAWARDTGAREVELGVTCGNNAAARLYRRAGFVSAGEPEPLRSGSPALAQSMRLRL